MTLNQSALIELLKELDLTDTTERIRLLTQRAFQELINAEAETVIGAAPYERSENRATQRNGTRPRTLKNRAPIFADTRRTLARCHPNEVTRWVLDRFCDPLRGRRMTGWAIAAAPTVILRDRRESQDLTARFCDCAQSAAY